MLFICLQNVPQVLIQIWFMSEYGTDEVVILSTVFSVISIVVAVFTVITQKVIIRNQSFVVIEFDVKEDSINRKMAKRINGIKKEIMTILGVHKRAVDIEQAHYLKNGGLHMKIYVDVIGNKLTYYRASMQKVIDSGAVAEMFRKHWKMQRVPVITALRCARMESDIELNSDTKMLISTMPTHESVRSRSM